MVRARIKTSSPPDTNLLHLLEKSAFLQTKTVSDTYPGGIFPPRILIMFIMALADEPCCLGSAWSLSRQYGQLSESSNHFLMQWSPKTCLHLGRRSGASLIPSGASTP